VFTQKDQEEILNRYIQTVKDKCIENNVQMLLTSEETVMVGGQPCSGYFDDVKPILAVATGKPFEEWAEIFVHESCHLDQFLEGADVWTDHKIHELDATGVMDLWLNGYVEMNPAQSLNITMKIIDVERDCEERVVKKIHDYGLPIDPVLYAKKANAYVLSYHVVRNLRRWYSNGKSPYGIQEILEMMPNHFDIDYLNPDTALLDVIEKHCFNLVD